MRKSIIEDIIVVNELFLKENPENDQVTRDYYRTHGSYSEKKLMSEFGSFKAAIKACKFPKKESKAEEPIYSRDTISITKEAKAKNQRYLVTTFVTGQEEAEQFIKNAEFYAKEKNATLVFLLARGVRSDHTISNELYTKYGKYFVTSMTFNRNLKAADFKVPPQNIVPKTSLDEIDNHCTYIVASPKLSLDTIANRILDYPHLIWTPGACTLPNYCDDRIGKLAIEHHTIGGLIVEVVDDEKFHIRNIIADKDGGFVDLGIKYHNNKMKKVKSEIVLGDVHVGVECPVAIAKTIDMIKELECSKVYINDLFDAQSVNPHVEGNLKAMYKRKPHQRFLDLELQYLGNFINNFSNAIGNKDIVVIPSNHDYFVDRYLNEGKFVFDDAENARLACELFAPHLDDINPIEYYLKSRKYITNKKISFPKRNDKLISYGYDIIHGDRGSGGAKGSARSFTKCYGRNISGHLHTPGIFKYSFQVGTLSLLDQPYIEGYASGWMHTNILVYENGTCQMVSIIDGEWKMN